MESSISENENTSGGDLESTEFFEKFQESRGDLSVINLEKFKFFTVKRLFLVTNVPFAETRGEHAHKNCAQYLIAISGSIRIKTDDGIHSKEVEINPDNPGVLIPAMVWSSQSAFSSDAILAVLASQKYDKNDYIYDYSIFKSIINRI